MSTPDRVRLPPLAPDVAARIAAPPRLAGPAAALAREAAAACVPVCLAMPAAAQRLLVARALHALARRPGALVAVVGAAPDLDDLGDVASLYVDAGALAPAGALALEAVLDDGRPWVLAAVDPGSTLPAPLAVRLDAVRVAVPPLPERTAELPALAAALLVELAARRGGRPPALQADALAVLAAHPWSGDLAELEAVLARCWLAAGDAGLLTAEHLGLGPPPTTGSAPASTLGSAALPASTGRAARDAAGLEMLLAEMAHELKNPLVTIKTFADRLPEVLADAELRDRFAALTGEAVTRMDGVLENVLAYARLGAPRPERLPVTTVVERAFAEADGALGARPVTFRHATDDVHCVVDPEHLAYALHNVLTGVAREAAPRGGVVVETATDGTIRIGFVAAAGAASRLRRLVTPDGHGDLRDPALLPLAFTLARAVLEDAGGSLAIAPDDGGRATVVVELPTAPTQRDRVGHVVGRQATEVAPPAGRDAGDVPPRTGLPDDASPAAPPHPTARFGAANTPVGNGARK